MGNRSGHSWFVSTEPWQTRHMASPQPVNSFSLRGVLVALVVGLGVLHLLVAVGRAHDWAVEGATLAATGLIHFVAAFGLMTTRRPRAYFVVLVWLTVTAAALVSTRTVGYPFGPFSGYAPSLSSYEFTVLGLSLAAAALIVGVLLVDLDVAGDPGWRFDTIAPAIVVIAAIPGLAATSWVDNASSLAGSGHVHDSSTLAIGNDDLSWGERTSLGEEIARVREIALSYPTLESALDAGWVMSGQSARGAGQMVVDASRDFRTMMFGVESPQGLIYASSDPTAPVVGVQFSQWVSSDIGPSGFVGQESLWHLHGATCIVEGPMGEYAVPLDEPTTGSGCQNVNGTRDDTVAYMIRAWVVPGWENPYGTFAHDHPALG